MTVQFDISCELEYAVSGPSEFLFNVQATESRQQRVLRESLVIEGARGQTEHVDPDVGNRFIRASAATGNLRLRYATVLRVDHHRSPGHAVRELDVAELPVEVLPYVLPSRYCQSDRLQGFAIREFGHVPRGAERVEAVCDWVHRNIRFASGTTNASTSAEEVLAQRTGVCRDFAHVTITLLRALNIPARFVTGYDYGVDPSYGPTDFHAYVEAYLGDRWFIFDATRLCPRTGLVRIGTGRDAADVAFATIFGPARFTGMKLSIEPRGMEAVAVFADDRRDALSTARLDDGMRWRGPRPLYGDYLAAA
jgi:transglutaminase-like putative cysteine protease